MKIKRKSRQLTYKEIHEGDVFSFKKMITQNDIETFAELTGDFNPLHVDLDFGRKSKFGRNIAHGLLVGSFFSTLVGMYCPGEKSLYVGQSFLFRLPIFVGDTVLVKGSVIGKNNSIKLITLKTEILKKDIIAVSGEAKVSFLE